MTKKELVDILATYTDDTEIWVEVKGKCINNTHLLTKIELVEDGLYQYKNGEFIEIPNGHSGVAIITASTTKKYKCILCQ